jgi:hypothetical protein
MTKKLPSPPVFNTPEEDDEFWQTHSPLDFEHEEVGIPELRRFVRLYEARFCSVEDK